MRSLSLALVLLVVVATGCSSNVPLTVKDGGSGKTLEGVFVERACPVSSISKILNPIGATYHPLSVAESNRTDKTGKVTFNKSSDRDVYRLYRDDVRPLVVSVFGKEIGISTSSTNQVAGAKWGYAIWTEDGALKQSAWAVRK